MKICIVGNEELPWIQKYNGLGHVIVKEMIRQIAEDADEIVSGECPRGGVDIWAKEVAKELGIPYKPFPPATNDWPGYKARNIAMASYSGSVICIAVEHNSYCYHCNSKDHLKSGGCWTMKHAKSIGRETRLIKL